MISAEDVRFRETDSTDFKCQGKQLVIKLAGIQSNEKETQCLMRCLSWDPASHSIRENGLWWGDKPRFLCSHWNDKQICILNCILFSFPANASRLLPIHLTLTSSAWNHVLRFVRSSSYAITFLIYFGVAPSCSNRFHNLSHQLINIQKWFPKCQHAPEL